jgi:hypothetical protein
MIVGCYAGKEAKCKPIDGPHKTVEFAVIVMLEMTVPTVVEIAATKNPSKSGTPDCKISCDCRHARPAI